MNTLKNIKLASFATLLSKTTLKEAIYLIKDSESRLGVFLESQKPVAILSESDIIKALNLDNDLSSIAKEFSTKEPITISGNRSYEYALKLMLSANVKRVPVCDDSREILGILTQDVLLKELSGDSKIKPICAINVIGAKKAISANVDDEIKSVLNIMSEKKIGIVPILDNHKAVGVIRESDILQSCEKPGFGTFKASEIMISPIVGIDEFASIDEIIEKFDSQNVKHLVVLSVNSKPIGVISKRDILKHLQENYLGISKKRDKKTKNTLDAFVYPVFVVSKSNTDLIIKWSNKATAELFHASLIDTPLKEIFEKELFDVIVNEKKGSSFFKKDSLVFDVKCSKVEDDELLVVMYDITDTYNLNQHIQSIIDVLPDLVVVTDGLSMTGANKSLLDFFGFTKFEDFRDEYDCICETFVNDIGYLEGDSEGEWLKEVFKNSEEDKKSHVKIISKDNHERIFEVKANRIQDKDVAVLIFSDVTENEKYKKLLQSNNSMLEEEIQSRTWELMEANDEITKNRQMLEEANKVAKILNWIYFTKLEVFEFYGDVDEIIPLTSKIVKASKLAEFFERRDVDELIAKIKNATQNSESFSALIELKNENETKDIRFRGKPYHIEDGDIISYFGTMQDISEERELEKMANIDELTGIHNRRKFNEISQYEFNRYQRFGHSFSLILFDIDKFKLVNDTYGHDVGDVVLKDIAKLVSGALREIDMFARWGGEEFVILVQDQSSKDAAFVAEKLRGMIEAHEFKGIPTLTCSFGVAQIDDRGLDDLFKRADVALYRAKTNGRNQVFSL